MRKGWTGTGFIRKHHCSQLGPSLQFWPEIITLPPGTACGMTSERLITVSCNVKAKGEVKVIPLQARCGPEGGQRYSSTLP